MKTNNWTKLKPKEIPEHWTQVRASMNGETIEGILFEGCDPAGKWGRYRAAKREYGAGFEVFRLEVETSHLVEVYLPDNVKVQLGPFETREAAEKALAVYLNDIRPTVPKVPPHVIKELPVEDPNAVKLTIPSDALPF